MNAARRLVLAAHGHRRAARWHERAAATGALWVAASLALAAGAAVYALDRVHGAALLPAWLAHPLPGRVLFGTAGDWLPSFTHAFAFTLLLAAALPVRRHAAALAACITGTLDVGFEIAQHEAWSAGLAAALPPWFAHRPVLMHLDALLVRGTFDPKDMAAVVVGCMSALPLAARTDFSTWRHQ